MALSRKQRLHVVLRFDQIKSWGCPLRPAQLTLWKPSLAGQKAPAKGPAQAAGWRKRAGKTVGAFFIGARAHRYKTEKRVFGRVLI